MGKGKGKIKTYCIMLSPNRIFIHFALTHHVVESIKKGEKAKIKLMSELKFLEKFVKKYPFLSIYKNF